MGIILMRSLTSGVFQRLMAEAFPSIDAVLSDGWSGTAATELCAFGSVRGRGAGGSAGTALCRAEQRDLGRRRVEDRPGQAAQSLREVGKATYNPHTLVVDSRKGVGYTVIELIRDV